MVLSGMCAASDSRGLDWLAQSATYPNAEMTVLRRVFVLYYVLYALLAVCCLLCGWYPGWVFERHPDLGIAMLEYQPGTIIDTVRAKSCFKLRYI